VQFRTSLSLRFRNQRDAIYGLSSHEKTQRLPDCFGLRSRYWFRCKYHNCLLLEGLNPWTNHSQTAASLQSRQSFLSVIRVLSHFYHHGMYRVARTSTRYATPISLAHYVHIPDCRYFPLWERDNTIDTIGSFRKASFVSTWLSTVIWYTKIPTVSHANCHAADTSSGTVYWYKALHHLVMRCRCRNQPTRADTCLHRSVTLDRDTKDKPCILTSISGSCSKHLRRSRIVDHRQIRTVSRQTARHLHRMKLTDHRLIAHELTSADAKHHRAWLASTRRASN
jgi:hypothetical protein